MEDAMLDYLLAPILAQFALKIGWIVALWMGLVLIAGAILARGRLRDLLASLGQLLAAVVTSPLSYLRKTVLLLCDYGRRGDAAFAGSDQFLLNRLVVFLQAGVVLLSLGVLAAGIVGSFDALVPPAEVREALAQAEERLLAQQKQLDDVTKQIADLDKAWEAEGAKTEQEFRQAREKTIRLEKQTKARIDAEIPPDTPIANAIAAAKQTVSNQGDPDSESAAENTRNASRSWMWYLDETDRVVLTNWTESWYREAIAGLELRQVSTESLRAGKQPNYAELAGQKAELESTVQATAASRDDLRNQAKLRFGPAFRRLVAAAVSILGLVWWLGLLLEALGLALHLTNDVRRLRERIVTQEGSPVAEPPSMG